MDERAKELIKDQYVFEDLVKIMELLRSGQGCPWDRAQTHESIRKNLIEECYEAVEGIDKRDPELLCEELGDLLLQIVFHAQISKDAGEFTIDDSINGVCRKMVNRHPHIFADEQANGAEIAFNRWEEMKSKEKKDETLPKTLERVARTLPSLMRTQKLLKKAEKAGFEKSGQAVGMEELRARYLSLCADANASGVDLEEFAYAINEEYIKEKSRAFAQAQE